jgi:parvulin-like peptidyl-prolyl isomerase
VSPQRGGRKASGKGRGRAAAQRPSDSVAAGRRALLAFGILFVALFAIVAISVGIGNPSVPDGDVLLVEDAAGDRGNVSQAEFDHALELAAAGEQKEVPKPDSKEYDELKETALTGLVEGIWLEGQAEEMGIEVTPQKIQREFQKIKKENFPTEAEFKKFLKESKFTQEDIDERVKLQILAEEVQEELKEDPPAPSDQEVESYYEAAKATQYTKPPSRDIRLIVNKEEEKAEKALAKLEEGNTAGDWSRVAKEFSEDPATKDKGGLQKGVAEGTLEQELETPVFDAPEGQLEGPLKAPRGFVVFEVQTSTPETVEPLSAVASQIESQLTQELEQEQFAAFVTAFNTKWLSRTICAEDYLTPRCANFEGDGRPQGAPPGCYEADPKGGRPEACPAPVFQAIPARPGSVTPLAPQGEPLAQRPHPAGEEKAPEEGATGIPGAGVPGEVPPPAE